MMLILRAANEQVNAAIEGIQRHVLQRLGNSASGNASDLTFELGKSLLGKFNVLNIVSVTEAEETIGRVSSKGTVVVTISADLKRTKVDASGQIGSRLNVPHRYVGELRLMVEHVTAEVVEGSLTIAEDSLEGTVESVDLTSVKVTDAQLSDDILTGNDIAKTSVANLGFNSESASHLGMLNFRVGYLGVEHDVAESLFISLDFKFREKSLCLNVQEGVLRDSQLEA
jgi:hypothetical protein